MGPYPNHSGSHVVRKSYGEFVAVDENSFTSPQEVMNPLDCWAPDGTGKSSTIRMMIGITAPDSGVINVFGRSFERKSQTGGLSFRKTSVSTRR